MPHLAHLLISFWLLCLTYVYTYVIIVKNLGVEKMEEVKKNKYAPQERYKKRNVKQIALQFNIKTDADILECLNSQPNKIGFIKKLIREYLKNN